MLHEYEAFQILEAFGRDTVKSQIPGYPIEIVIFRRGDEVFQMIGKKETTLGGFQEVVYADLSEEEKAAVQKKIQLMLEDKNG